MSQQSELHNRIAGEIVVSIVRPIFESGGRTSDVMVLLESVMVGVIFGCTKLGGDEIILDELMDAVKRRLAELRLGELPPIGRA